MVRREWRRKEEEDVREKNRREEEEDKDDDRTIRRLRRNINKEKNSKKQKNNGETKRNVPSSSYEWEKILWRRQPYPDNYSGGDERFLADLKKNVSAVWYKWDESFRAGCHLLLHLDIVVISILLFEAIQVSDDIVLYWMCILSSLIILSIYLIYIFILPHQYHSSLDTIDHVHTIVTITALGYALIPIIRTLTTTISTDTIYAMAIGSSCIGCIFHDYGITTPLVSHPLSLSAGLSSSVLLISRLDDDSSAFFYLTISFILHAFIAPVRNKLYQTYPNVSLALGAILAIAATVLLSWINITLSLCWAFFHIVIAIICPRYLLYLQQGKRTIHGPWDEAVLRRKL